MEIVYPTLVSLPETARVEPAPLPTRVDLPFKLPENNSFQGLGKGSQGQKVARLQAILQRWNPKLGISTSGKFDEATQKGMALYQAIYGQDRQDQESSSISERISGYLSAMEDGSFWSNPPQKSPGQHVLYQAAQQLGKPYCLGGDGRNSTDCGLLVSQAGQKLAPNLGRCADSQYLSALKGTDRLKLGGSPKGGDLLFFRTQTHQSDLAFAGITHVGLAINSNWMLAASSAAGKVTIQPMQPMKQELAARAQWV